MIHDLKEGAYYSYKVNGYHYILRILNTNPYKNKNNHVEVELIKKLMTKKISSYEAGEILVIGLSEEQLWQEISKDDALDKRDIYDKLEEILCKSDD